MDKIINFFKYIGIYDEEYFQELQKNTYFIDGEYEEICEFIGCFIKNDDEYRIMLPIMKTDFEVLIGIHEYTHMLFLDDNSEIFPNLMEAIYINNFIDDISIKKQMFNMTKEQLDRAVDQNHIIGKKVKINSIKI